MAASRAGSILPAEVPARRVISATTPVFQALIEHHLDAIALLDGDGSVQYLSPSAQQVLGLRAEHLPLQIDDLGWRERARGPSFDRGAFACC
ncbi:MAG TPA: PAS domain-containing protein [Thermomicrobiaceae bacterium]|nr:PAS domain-containing protein [Thermomicrobiaceae bacterium]